MVFFDFVICYIFFASILFTCYKNGFVNGYSLIFHLFLWYT